MITLEDIEDMSALTRAEIDAVAEHENTSLFDATLMGEYMMHVHLGPQKEHEMLSDDIRSALHEDKLQHARDVFEVLRRFLSEHPEAALGVSILSLLLTPHSTTVEC